MHDLNTRIAQLETCSQQLRLHLHSLPKDAVEADEVRSDLLGSLQTLVALKGRRQKLEAELRLVDAA